MNSINNKLKNSIFLIISLSIAQFSFGQNINADTTLANEYYELARQYTGKYELDSALFYSEKAQELYIKYWGENSLKNADVVHLTGNIYYNGSVFDEALRYYNKSLTIRLGILGVKHFDVAQSYNNIGNAYKNKSEYDKALEYHHKSLEIRTELFGEKHTLVADSYNNIGNVYSDKSEYDKALEYYFKSLEIRKDLYGEKHKTVAASYNNIGIIFDIKSEYDKAFEYYFKSLKIKKELLGEKSSDVADSYMNIGVVYKEKSEYDKALEYFLKSLEIRIELLGEGHTHVADSYTNIGIVYIDKTEYEKALEYLFKSLNIQLELFGEKHMSVASLYTSIGLVYNYKSENDKALEYLFKSLNIQLELFGEKHMHVAASYNNIGIAYNDKSEFQKALEYHFKSLTIRKQLLGEKNTDVTASYINIGNVYKEIQEYDKALDYYFKNLEIKKELLGKKHSHVAGSYNNIASIYYLLSEYEKALNYYNRGIASNCLNFTDTSTIFSVPKIKDYLDWGNLLESLRSKAEIFTDANFNFREPKQQLKIALLNYQACDTLIDQTRKKITRTSDKIALGETAHQIYSGAIATCLKLASIEKLASASYYNQKAFYFSEKNKGMVLLEALAGQESLKFAGIPDSLLEKEHSLKIDINLYEEKLAEITDSTTEYLFRSKLFTANRQYEELIAKFENQYPEYFNLKYTQNNPTIFEIQNLLDNQTALRSYSVGDTMISIFTITKINLNIVQVKKMENFDDSLKYFCYGLKLRSPLMQEYYQKLGYSFYQQLFPDILDEKIQNIIVVPDGSLGIIPFESLLTANYSGDIGAYQDYPYLIKKYNISYSYSANLFAKTFPKDKTKNVEFTNLNDWLAFAPVFSDENKQGTVILSRELRNNLNLLKTDSLMTRGTMISGDYINPLPGTEQETQIIFNIFNQKNKKAQLLLYDKANENFLKSSNLNQYRIIHFATHGFVNSEKPELSGIILNQDTTGGEDGILYSGEFYNLMMNADLVVLSACETGLGKIRKGEGIIGLTRALLYAGAKNIVVSLWQVNDQSTSDLMIDFYKNLLDNQKQTFSKSLQQAKLKMISEGKYAHPFYWSPFILIGN